MKNQVVKKITLNNFRCHSSFTLDCTKNPTQILGKNGWGKTSVLEALYIAMQGKSFRATDKEILQREADFYRVEIEYTSGEKVSVAYENGSTKKFLVKDKKFSRLPKLEKYPIVLFLPEDLRIAATSPQRRREYFDRIISQIDDSYSKSLSRYNKALKQRNELLKQDYVTSEAIFSWDIILSRLGVEISKKRAEFTEDINKYLTKTYQEIAKNSDTVEIKYDAYTRGVDESTYLKLLQLDFERDTITGHTNFGIHKDDYKFFFNSSPADGNASRGEMRSIVLALKFIEARLILEKLGKKPLVLLDDVFSELDKTRQRSLTKNFSDHQVILTSVKGVD